MACISKQLISAGYFWSHGLQEVDCMALEFSFIEPTRAWKRQGTLGFPVLEYKATIQNTRSLRNRHLARTLQHQTPGKAPGFGVIKRKSHWYRWSTPTQNLGAQMPENLQLSAQTRRHTQVENEELHPTSMTHCSGKQVCQQHRLTPPSQHVGETQMKPVFKHRSYSQHTSL